MTLPVVCILQTKVIIFKILLHCQCLLCSAQMVASNWAKFIIGFWSPIITIVLFSMAYFHFFIIERQMSWWEQIHVANLCRQVLVATFATNRVNSSYGLNSMGPLCLWQCLFWTVSRRLGKMRLSLTFRRMHFKWLYCGNCDRLSVSMRFNEVVQSKGEVGS